MQRNKLSAVLGPVVMLVMASLSLSGGAFAQGHFKLLYSVSGSDGNVVDAPVILDTAGNIYGTTLSGGVYGFGTAFRLTPNSYPQGTWTESVIYSFARSTDGAYPRNALIFDAAGNLYGTTQAGGTYDRGNVFKLTPNPDGNWTASTLYSFTGGNDGSNPLSSLIFDAAGNLYGTTHDGGNLNCNPPTGCGVVFQLVPNSDGSWTENVLVGFAGGDGVNPWAGLTSDAAGNLYGTTAGGEYSGTIYPGTIFELTPNSNGTWTGKVLYHFFKDASTTGAFPAAKLILDTDGNLYGTTIANGTYSQGTAFMLKPDSAGWTYHVLHEFTGGKDGAKPWGGLTLDAAGNLYGTTIGGGDYSWGTIFKLKPGPKSWMLSALHQFTGGKDGGQSATSLTLDASGNLYGTAQYGGMNLKGSIFEVIP